MSNQQILEPYCFRAISDSGINYTVITNKDAIKAMNLARIAALEKVDGDMLQQMLNNRREPTMPENEVIEMWNSTAWHKIIAAQIQELKSQMI